MSWKEIPGFEGRYKISSHGEVFSIRSKKVLAPCKRLRYLSVKLGAGRHYLIHRLVLLAFFGPSKLQCNHINGIPTDNRLSNLEYCTSQENNIHAVKVLKLRTGENGNSRFTDADVRKMRALYKAGTKQTVIAKMFDTYQGVISNIIAGRSRA